jgi:excinuclease ABC subunit A
LRRLRGQGPEGGDAASHLVAVGTPEDVAREPQNHTGQYLKQALDRRRLTKRAASVERK